MPSCSELRSSCSRSAEESRALEGMHPTFRQVPPRCSFSISATEAPSWAARIAATYPPGPPPITTMSKLSGMGLPLHEDQVRLLEYLLDPGEEQGGRVAVDDPVV